jgi:hypothetical protein
MILQYQKRLSSPDLPNLILAYGWRTCALVVSLTLWCVAQDAVSSKTPEGEAQFTEAQLKGYYRIYENSDVRYLRTVFNSYLSGAGGDPRESGLLDKWSEDYFRSKFIVMSRNGNPFGGTLIAILFQDRPDKVFVAWIYPEGSAGNLKLREFSPGNFNQEDTRQIQVRYKALIQDKKHAL